MKHGRLDVLISRGRTVFIPIWIPLPLVSSFRKAELNFETLWPTMPLELIITHTCFLVSECSVVTKNAELFIKVIKKMY